MRWPPIPPIWRGQTAYIIGGGPSFCLVDPERLRGRNLVAVNSSWEKVPFAGVMYFSDPRWWRHYGKEAAEKFQGHILTTDKTYHKRVWVLKNSCPPRAHLNKKRPPIALSTDPCAIPMKRTSLVPAMNIAAHLLGMSGRIVLFGADGQFSQNKKRNHYRRVYPWQHVHGCWEIQKRDLMELAPYLRVRGIEVLNASPGSVWADIWPVVEPEEVLRENELDREGLGHNGMCFENATNRSPQASNQAAP